MPSINVPSTLIRSGRASAQGAATEIEISIPPRVKLVRVKLLRVSGTGATLTPRLVSTTGAAAGSFEEEWAVTATPVGTKIDVSDISILIGSETTKKLYLVPTFDAGSDNVLDYALYFDVVSQ